MQRSMKLALVFIAVVVTYSSVQYAYTLNTPPSRWAGSALYADDIPVQNYVNPTNWDGFMPGQVMAEMQRGADVWNDFTTFQFDPPIELPATSGTSHIGRSIPSINQVLFDDDIDDDQEWTTERCCNVAFFRNAVSGGAIATTYTWVLTDDHTIILASDQVYWSRRWFYAIEPETCSGEFYLGGIRAHESGHTLGLAHSGDANATMYASAATCDADLDYLDPDDIDGLVALYGDVTDIAITSVSAPSAAVQTDQVSVNVTVENVGSQNATGDITVSLSESPDGYTFTDQVINGGLLAGASDIVNFMWDTTSAAVGDHTLDASHNTADDVITNNAGSTMVTVTAPGVGVTVGNISPASVSRNAGVVTFTITGSGFANDASVSFENGAGQTPQVNSVTFVTSTEITAEVQIRSGGPRRNRVWDVRVTNGDGSTGVGEGLLTITP